MEIRSYNPGILLLFSSTVSYLGMAAVDKMYGGYHG